MREIKFRAWDFDNQVMIGSDSLAFEGYAPIKHLLSLKGIMQYTELKDKNGKEIYEGDIVSMFQGSQKSEVLFEGGMFSVKRAYRTSFYHDEFELRHEILFNVIDTCEVIGNIYENPELLEGLK